MQKTRRVFQFIFLAAALFLTMRNLAGCTKATVESYCPGGGLESIIYYWVNSSFLCATSGMNLILFLAVLAGTLLIGRAFCSWVCPIGTIMELLRKIGISGGIASMNVWKGRFRAMQYLRYFILAAVLYFTYKAADLVFRSYCPLYIVIALQEHEVDWWSKWVMLLIGIFSAILPFFWCRLICPLGTVLGVARMASPLSPTVTSDKCTSCGKCERECPQQIDIVKPGRVQSTDCTQCLACIDACPAQCISLSLGYGRDKSEASSKTPGNFAGKLSPKLIPVVVGIMMAVGFFFAFNLPVPTFVRDFQAAKSGVKLANVEMIVTGLRCRGQSNILAWILEEEPAVARIETFVSEFKARIFFDPALTDPLKIAGKIEAGRIRSKSGSTDGKVVKFNVERILGK